LLFSESEPSIALLLLVHGIILLEVGRLISSPGHTRPAHVHRIINKAPLAPRVFSEGVLELEQLLLCITEALH